jgi:hypothetical protein
MKLMSKTNWFVAFLLIAPKIVFACEMSRALTETQFIIDPALKKSQMESVKNNAQIEVGRCTTEDKFLYINLNTIFFQDDTSRQETNDGVLSQKISNCSIESELPFQKMDVLGLQSDVANKNKFIRKCVYVVIGDQRGQKLQFDPQSKCSVRPLVEDGSTVETDGIGCLLSVNANSRIAMETRINPECMDSQFLNQNQIQAGDYESVIKIFPALKNADVFSVGQPIGQRYIRHTLLPAKSFMPRAVKEDEEHYPYISALSTNISPGNVRLTSVGNKRYLVEPTFLVENLAKEYCKGEECARTTSFVVPIAGMLKLTQLNARTGRRTQIGEWGHALKIPSNWSGIAEFKNENNLSGLTMGALEAEMILRPGDIYELGAQFYEPRTFLDEMMSMQDYMDINNNLNIGAEVNDSLPQLPTAGKLLNVGKLPKMPSVSLGYKGILDLTDQFNMKKNWSQKYDRICNNQNLMCIKLEGLNRAISTIKMKFKIGDNNEIIPISVSKKSPVFESYEKEVTSFPKKVCQ